jgi:drug/metabolite transporter (DMT)-like permease
MDLSKGARLKTRIFALIVVLSNAFGNCLITLGLRQRPGRLALSPFEYILAIFNPWVALGVVLLILWLLSRMALLSWADLSYVLPVTASGYVVTAFMGLIFLKEHISTERWAGTLLIAAGILLVARTAPRTTAKSDQGSKIAAASIEEAQL